ncbi:MAG: hypothetical protein WCC04_20300 [Terriglobales bacterium]
MNGSKASGSRGVFAHIAMMLATIFVMFLIPAYGQQEVDPTWYDPWAPPKAAVVQTAQTPTATAKHARHRANVKSAPSPQRAGKVEAKVTARTKSS